ncbi:small cardioactive peptides [Aplysia californica]|uniref:Small cardioactive peptides n=1 Tax=Aplysia californica TaxID=6500 RepID=SCP_APLCA|nr:small cardioactive peptides [Aplysia californica]P09892.1 RecName: Full=Small cardioactive peptides; Contains: RecName: Full=Small cardioactive peptide B; Short=SCP B; Contains: RecName: Full=Small cardioactive peptide A; Short=SCP A; Flags: Precursor [Aplysia californica]AAA27777.1 small cardioactive peptide B [Aplysia sp.]
METSVSRVTVSLTLLVLIICSADAMNYLAFPRMGRARPGYLAFPRMGRSQMKTETGTDCCGLGMKSEFVIGQEGKEELRHGACSSSVACCAGLREIVDQKQDGVFFSMCVPDFVASRSSEESSSEVLSKLKSLLQK